MSLRRSSGVLFGAVLGQAAFGANVLLGTLPETGWRGAVGGALFRRPGRVGAGWHIPYAAQAWIGQAVLFFGWLVAWLLGVGGRFLGGEPLQRCRNVCGAALTCPAAAMCLLGFSALRLIQG